MSSYDNLNLNLCETLYTAGTGAVTAPLYTYNHAAKVANETCPTGHVLGLRTRVLRRRAPSRASTTARSSSPTTRATASGSCSRTPTAIPDPATTEVFINGAAGPVDLQVGPGGDLFYADLSGGTIRRVHSLAPNGAPVARATADPDERRRRR